MRNRKNGKLKFAVTASIILLTLTYAVAKPKYSRRIMLMAYNVENLFDATNDGVNQEDVTYLPLAIKKTWKADYCKGRTSFYYKQCKTLDWTQDKYEEKLRKIAQVILTQNS